MKKNQLLCLALAALLALCCVSALAESAAAPVCQQPTKDGKLHGHWYGEWFPTRVKHHTAFCRYDGCGEERETSGQSPQRDGDRQSPARWRQRPSPCRPRAA